MRKLVFGILFLLLTPHASAIPTIQHWTTANGARVFFSPASEIPIVDIRVVFDAGAARDGDHAGLASLTNSLLSEGAGELDADVIAARFDTIGAQLNNGALRDMAWLSLRSLSDAKTLREAAELMALLLSQPTFPERSFERMRKGMLVGLRASQQDPGSLAEDAFMEAIYGDHPYAIPPHGTEESVTALTLADVQRHYARYYVADNAIVVIVGDVTRDDAEDLADILTASLPNGEKAAALPAPQMTQSEQVHVRHPSTQTHIWVGHPGMQRTDADYYPLYIGNHALGGNGLVSLLSDEIREQRGYAYSAYSYFIPMRVAGPFKMVLQTKNASAMPALQVLRQTLQRYLQQGITQEQLTASVKNISGGFALRLDSNKKLAEYIAMIGFYGLPLDYLHKFNERIEAVTLEQINDALRRRIKPEDMITVIVGPDALAE